tara:strand:- start:1098 stop:1310 length:213 start_codon:yes stop_codon:yes gene_type:complete
MADKCSTTLEWRGSAEIGLRLSNLIPDGFDYELTEENGDSVLVVNVTADSLETLRELVDNLLTIFSDQDQ